MITHMAPSEGEGGGKVGGMVRGCKGREKRTKGGKVGEIGRGRKGGSE